MQYFVSTLEEYVMTEVITTAWMEVKRKLPTLDNFDDLVELHSEYLDFICDKCFISLK
jgi:hypothetical protein